AHGYNQAAFLAEIISGAGAAEIHSYPYLYNNIPINTTFFKLITRDTFRLEISSGEAITLLNSAPYPYDYALEYRFLQNQAANYVGMAQAYRESLGLSPQAPAAQRVPLRLIMLGVDYKPGLFGKKYQTMTDFSQALAIIKSLENNDVEDFQITYLGWNRGGYYNNRSSGRKISRQLGAIDLLNDYIKEKKYKIDYTVNPLISDRYGFGAKTIKKINLSPFKIEQKSSLVNTAYYLAPSTLAAAIKSNGKYYHKKQIEAFNIDNLAAAFSYRYQNEVFYREMMTSLIPEELEQLTDFTLSTANPHDYLLAYLCNYYNAPYQSNKYIYVTDSVPFLSLLLSGFINLYAPEVNYLSDYYYLAALRMIEYNLYPSFIITSSEAHHLRYTNFEYLLSTEYRLWENLIIEIYKTVNEALGRVRGQRMVEHGYPVCGVAQVVYDDGTVILINYNDVDYSSPYGLVKAGSYLVSGGDKS
ncbi:MAG: DUF5696 domain-containing protein, partial [Bacilli bacterium]|nr:DUF5696 domain-containing protein [Bacilli bacterium]